ncbi:MAG: nucleotidyltransferase family protein [Candidatus Norongarragalinales archaeon]
MKAVILCGGKGTRLRPYTLNLPKPMLLLGRKPVLEYTVEHLASEGITDLVFTVGHLREKIEEHFGDGRAFGVHIKYSVEEGELGTAGSVKNAQALIKDDDFLVLMGDQLTSLSYRKVFEFHLKHKDEAGAIATVALKRLTQPLQVGIAHLDKATNKVTRFEEKPVLENLGNAAVYAFNKKIWGYLPQKGDFAFDVLPRLAREGKLLGFVFDDYWIDMGYVREYEEINEAISLMDLILHAKKRGK